MSLSDKIGTLNLSSKVKLVKIDVSSSIVEYMEYAPSLNRLRVKYKKRGWFKKKVKNYDQVPKTAFLEIVQSKSIGRALRTYISSKRK